jgi:hypothetical protein
MIDSPKSNLRMIDTPVRYQYRYARPHLAVKHRHTSRLNRKDDLFESQLPVGGLSKKRA